MIFESGLLKIKLDNNPNPYYALNEMRVENIVKSQIMDIYVDGEFLKPAEAPASVYPLRQAPLHIIDLLEEQL